MARAVLSFLMVPQVCGHAFRELKQVISWCLRGLDSVQVFTVTLAMPLDFSDNLNLRGNPCFLWRGLNFCKICEALCLRWCQKYC